MEHITNVLVYSNRCEVLDNHVFTVGDKGFPHIRLKFLYMFGAETLQGKELELKYILPDKSYHVEKITVSGKDEALFPIHYSVFVNGGWTTLKVSILEGANRIALDDIIIKTKKLEVGQEFQHKEVKAIVETEITKRTEEIRVAADEVKTKLSKDLETLYQEKVKALDKEVKTSVSTHFEEKADDFNGEINKAKIKDLSYLDNKLKVTLNDNSNKEVVITSMKMQTVFEGEIIYTGEEIKICDLPAGWKIIFITMGNMGFEFAGDVPPNQYFFTNTGTKTYFHLHGSSLFKIQNNELFFTYYNNNPVTKVEVLI